MCPFTQPEQYADGKDDPDQENNGKCDGHGVLLSYIHAQFMRK
jgi:hypothetical protein